MIHTIRTRHLVGLLCLSTVASLTAIDVGVARAEEGHAHNLFCGHDHSGPGLAFSQTSRWTQTATDGSGLQRGQPTTLTWSIVPDGTDWFFGDSSIVSFLDSTIGGGPGGSGDLTQRPWFSLIDESLNRWGQVSGLSYVYVGDDGAALGAQGVLGARGDVRIGGTFDDGNGGVLARNQLPNGGDMNIDTGDTNFYGQSFQNFLPLRNVIQHEHGHGLGMLHVESNNSGFLMEPFIQYGFDGIQLDEIRAVQLFYGDALEKNGGNNTSGTATVLGNIQNGDAAIGLDAPTGDVGGAPEVFPGQTDFISLGSEDDTDFFSFDIDSASELSVLLTPRGATYSQGPQGGSQSDTDTTDDVDLILSIFDTDGFTLLADADLTGNGFAEFIDGLLLDGAGTYFARVTGVGTNVQLYSLELSAVAVPEPATLAGLGVAGLALLRRRRAA